MELVPTCQERCSLRSPPGPLGYCGIRRSTALAVDQLNARLPSPPALPTTRRRDPTDLSPPSPPGEQPSPTTRIDHRMCRWDGRGRGDRAHTTSHERSPTENKSSKHLGGWRFVNTNRGGASAPSPVGRGGLSSPDRPRSPRNAVSSRDRCRPIVSHERFRVVRMTFVLRYRYLMYIVNLQSITARLPSAGPDRTSQLS